MLSFEWLIEPVPTQVFFKDYYEQKPLLIEGTDRARFSPLLSIEAIDRYLATGSPCHPDVFLVDAARQLKPDDYAFPDSGRIDLPRAYQLFSSGATSRPTSISRPATPRGSRPTTTATTSSCCRWPARSSGPCTTR
jgi:hypothetical protein